MEADNFKKELEKEYLLIKKGKWWSFLGGAMAFLVVTGLISYKASLQAVEGTAAKNATDEILRLKGEAQKEQQYISERNLESERLIQTLNTRVEAITGLLNKLNSIQSLVEEGNPWKPYSNNVKDVLKDTQKYEYAIMRNGGFRQVSASTWNSGYRVMTEPYMTGDNKRFTLGGSVWIWNTNDARDDSGVYHMYYYATNEGVVATTSGNGLTKADAGGEGEIFRRPRK